MSRLILAGLIGLLAARVMLSGSIHPWVGLAQNAAFIIITIWALFFRPGTLAPRSRLLTAGMVLFFGAAALSAAFSLNPWSSLHWLLLQVGGLFVFLSARSIGRKHPEGIAAGLLVALAFSVAFAFRQRLGGFQETLNTPGISDYARLTLLEGRVFGLTFSPDMLAASLAAGIPLALSLLSVLAPRDGVTVMQRMLPAGVILLLVPAIFLTRSLGGFIAAGCGVIAWIWLTLIPRLGPSRKRLMIAVILALLAAGAWSIIFSRDGHLFNLDDPDNSAAMRLENWKQAVRVWREFPVTGAGGGQLGVAVLSHRGAGNEARHSHNLFLETLAETGPLGVLGLALIFAAFIGQGVRLWRETRREEPGRREPEIPVMRIGFWCSAAAVAAHSLIDFSFQTMEVAVFFWAGLAMAAEDPAEPATPKAGPVRIAAAVAMLALAGLTLHQMRYDRLLGEAMVSAGDGEWEKALAEAREALELSPMDDRALDLMARAELTIDPADPKRRKQAKQYYQRALTLNPRYPYYSRNIAMLSTDRNESLRYMKRAVEHYPESLELNLQYARMLMTAGKEAKAEEALVMAIKSNRRHAEALLELGLLHARQGRHKKAAQELKRAAEMPPPDPRRQRIYREYLESSKPAVQ